MFHHILLTHVLLQNLALILNQTKKEFEPDHKYYLKILQH
jgi:hypothetical protein